MGVLARAVLKRAEVVGMPVTERRWRRIRGLNAEAAIGVLREMGFS